MANTYLTRTVSSGADLTKWTWSCWVKRTDLVGGGNNYQRLISNEVNGNAKSWYIRFQSSTQFHAWSNNGAFEFTTNGKYRDINGWYHLVVKYDSTQSTEADRLKVYVNGEEPSMSAIHYPTLNEVCNFMNTGNYVDIGYYRQGSSEYFHGLMSHMHFTAGYAYDASAFGSTDANGVWTIKTSPSVTYGSQGFFILKDGNSVTDQSGNSNNFTVGGGTLTKTEDNPSNVFATVNPLDTRPDRTNTFSNGNTTYSTNAMGRSTLAATSGKWYAETEYTVNELFNGVSSMVPYLNNNTRYVALYGENNGEIYVNGSVTDTNVGAGTAIADGSIIMIAMDLDNNKLYFAKNGVWQNSGDPTSGATGTGSAFTIADGTYGFTVYGYQQKVWNANFGNGYFGTTAVSSAQNPDDGIGIFEYDVPAGYYALNTKAINAQEYD